MHINSGFMQRQTLLQRPDFILEQLAEENPGIASTPEFQEMASGVRSGNTEAMKRLFYYWDQWVHVTTCEIYGVHVIFIYLFFGDVWWVRLLEMFGAAEGEGLMGGDDDGEESGGDDDEAHVSESIGLHLIIKDRYPTTKVCGFGLVFAQELYIFFLQVYTEDELRQALSSVMTALAINPGPPSVPVTLESFSKAFDESFANMSRRLTDLRQYMDNQDMVGFCSVDLFEFLIRVITCCLIIE